MRTSNKSPTTVLGLFFNLGFRVHLIITWTRDRASPKKTEKVHFCGEASPEKGFRVSYIHVYLFLRSLVLYNQWHIESARLIREQIIVR